MVLLADLVDEVTSGDWGDAAHADNREECIVLRGTDFQRLTRTDISEAPHRFLKQASVLKRQLVPGDLLVETSGGSEAQPTGRLVRIGNGLTNVPMPVTFSNFVKRLRLNPNVDSQYFSLAWESLYRQGRTRPYEKRTTGIRNFRLDDFLASETISLPPLEEQRHIARILSTIQRVSQRIDRVRAAASHTRDAMVESLLGELTPSVRIGEIGVVKGGKRLPKGHAFASDTTPYPYIRIVDFEDGSVRTTDLRYLVPEDRERIVRYVITRYDVYISIAGTIGLAGVIPDQLDGANLTENAARIVITDRNHINERFLAWYLRSPMGQEQIRVRTTKTSQPKLALMRIADISIPIPPLAQQIEIASALDLISRKLHVERESKRALLRVFDAALATLMGTAA